MLSAASAVVLGAGAVVLRAAPAYADGPVACGPLTTPVAPEAGFCADYNGDTTWYGTYGPGFPTAQGFGLCGEPPASGGGFPSPSYHYVLGAQPAGAGGDWNALGFAFSEGSAAAWWGGVAGQFSADQAAAAAKIVYDTVVWGSPIPSMDPGVLAAFNDFYGWYLQARGMAAGPPVISAGLTSNSGSFTGSATDQIHLEFPGTDSPLVGQGVLLSITNGTFNSVGGPTTAGLSTDQNGNVLIPIFAAGSGTVSVTVSSITEVGQPGLAFFHPTTGDLAAQVLVGFTAPTELRATEALQATGTPPVTPTGTVSVQKSGDDEAYDSVAGAVFDVEQGGTTVATLSTDASGTTPDSGSLPVGTYIVHEQVPPAGYQVAPDQQVAVTANANTVAQFTGTAEDHVTPSTLTLHKVDAESGEPLAGAVFDVTYSSANNGSYDQDLGTCTTDATGACSPGGNDGTAFLPGNYRVDEVTAPPGYFLDPAHDSQTITLTPGQAGSVTFADFVLGSLTLHKSGNDTAYTPIEGATFSVSGPIPSVGVIGTLTVAASGSANTLSGLTPGSYTVTETTPPAGYGPVAPQTVAVPAGSTTTTLDVTDLVIPAALSLVKVDRQTGAPLAGAVFDVAYDPTKSGNYSLDLGHCTTGVAGHCLPVGNDGPSALLPGRYQVTEITAPAGYALDPTSATQLVTLTPGQASSVTFSDPKLVPATFEKVASGNVNASIDSLAGAQLVLHAGTPTGAAVAGCTTDATGRCTTATVLESGRTYCWAEVAAPIGLAPAGGACFVADNAQAVTPIVVTDAGLFVAIEAKKVDAADPAVTVPGAVFDLFRTDGGQGPGVIPTAPAGTPTMAGSTYMARATSGGGGLASFPLQFPGFAYCVLEVQAPANYSLDPSPQCTGVLTGAATVPAALTVVTVSDAPQLITLAAHKFNATAPDTSIPGATYDLYVEGSLPPATTAPMAPADARSQPGDAWFARGTTDGSGNLSFSVPAGYAWCLLEHTAPADYVPDPALHCSSTLTTSSPPEASTIALPETLATVYLSAHKYDAAQPSTVIAGATYALLLAGTAPAGASAPAPAAPVGLAVPSGDTYWGQGTTDTAGLVSFAVPAGSSWCLLEVSAPAGYAPDPDTHCTGILTNQTSALAASLALPELPSPGPLAFTGGPSIWVPTAGLVLVVGGIGLLVLRRRLAASALRAGALVDGVDEHAQPSEVPLVETQGQTGKFRVVIT